MEREKERKRVRERERKRGGKGEKDRERGRKTDRQSVFRSVFQKPDWKTMTLSWGHRANNADLTPWLYLLG